MSAMPGKVALFQDRGGEARLGEDHHAGRGLQQMRAGARADDEEERVLDLAMQPDDAGQAAENLALAALANDGDFARRRRRRRRASALTTTPPHGRSATRRLQPRRAQLQQELRWR